MGVLPLDSEILGAQFGTAEMRALFGEKAQLQVMLDVEVALARALARFGLVPEHVTQAIERAARVENLDLKELAESARMVGHPVVGLVRELGRAAGEEAARYIHWGATAQDILDTAMVLQIRQAAALVRRDLVGLACALADKARRFRDTPMAGRTHLKQAVPITFGLKCATWAAPLPAHIERLDQACRRLAVVQFGGAAGTLAALGSQGLAVLEALADDLGLGVPDAPWHTVRDGFAEMVAVLGLICGSLGKFAFDVMLLGQSEVGEVAEPYREGRGGSSTMPQKRNPVASEHVLAACHIVPSLVAAMLGAMIQDHERARGLWQSEPLILPQCFVLSAGALAQARTVAEGMTVDPARMLRNLQCEGGLIMAEALATHLTPALGRRAAHEAVERLCQRTQAERRSLGEAISQEPELIRQLGGADVSRLTDPTCYLGSAATFVDRIVARIAKLA